MTRYPPPLSPAPRRRPTRVRPPIGRVGAVAVLLVLVAALVPAGRWLWTRQSLGWQVERGLELLAGADNPLRVRAALDQWEAETRTNWESRRDELVAHLVNTRPLEDQRVRRLLTRVAGADYGPRRDDWQRWYDARKRLRHGLPPDVARRETVRLERRWAAPVGLTTWFTTILPLDGQVFVASLGADFNDPRDEADGIVRVDGGTGRAELLFTPPAAHRGPRDVIGLATADDGLIAACFNGSVYSLDKQGQVRWHSHVGDPVVAPPLTIDLNRDGTDDVLVVTRAARVIALSGRGGKTVWVTGLGKPTAGTDLLGATLALGQVPGGADHELIVTLPTGQVEVLGLRDGRSRGRHELAAGTVAGVIGLARLADSNGPAACIADRAAAVWSLVGSAGRTEAVRWDVLSVRRDETLVAGLRTLRGGRGGRGGTEAAGLLLACPTGPYTEGYAAVCALATGGLQWRFPLEGAVWATPAVADLNGDGAPEIVVAGVTAPREGPAGGVVVVLSSAGHCLNQVLLDTPVECSPVVADVDGDRLLEILVADQAGRLHCFATAGYGPVEWGTFGGDSRNTRNATNAYAFGQMPAGYQWTWKP